MTERKKMIEEAAAQYCLTSFQSLHPMSDCCGISYTKGAQWADSHPLRAENATGDDERTESVACPCGIVHHVAFKGSPASEVKRLRENERLRAKFESAQAQMACFRKAIVYGRHALNITETKKEEECAKILEDARSEGDRIMKQYLTPEAP